VILVHPDDEECIRQVLFLVPVAPDLRVSPVLKPGQALVFKRQTGSSVSDLIEQPVANEPEYGITGGYMDPVAAAKYEAWSKALRSRLTLFWWSLRLNLQTRLYHLGPAFGTSGGRQRLRLLMMIRIYVGY
jgi:hypothetical protein